MVRAALALSGLYRSKDQGKSVVRSQKRLGSKKGSRGDAESADEEPEGKVTPEKEKQISEGRAAEVCSRFVPIFRYSYSLSLLRVLRVSAS